ncbi:MAG: type II toxin-antitoxin system HicB family antitoxin [Thermomicrobiales bacterium]
MAGAVATYDNVRPDELEEARGYRMEIAWSPDDEVFVVSFPDAPGVMTHGATREEAVAQGEDAIISWLTAHHDAGLPPPPPAVTLRNASDPTIVPRYTPDQIRQIRRTLDISQHVFAVALNVSRGAVRSWEQGTRQPDGAAMRLLHIAETHPDILFGSGK